MNWEAVGAISESVGAAGVLTTLIYLALQIRSQSQETRIQNMRARASEQGRVFAMQATAETMEAAIAKAYVTGEELSVAEHHAVEAFVASFLLSAECDFRIYKEGLMPLEDWTPIREQMKLVLHAEPVQVWWNSMTSQMVTAAFRSEVDSVITEIQDQPNPYRSPERSPYQNRPTATTS